MFLTRDFLLKNDTAKKLYHDFAAEMPIVDYHCHINPQEIYEDRKFDSITRIWLGGDHYKWRLIRSNGVNEDEITGNADDLTKFRHFAKMLSKAIGKNLTAVFVDNGFMRKGEVDEIKKVFSSWDMSFVAAHRACFIRK